MKKKIKALSLLLCLVLLCCLFCSCKNENTATTNEVSSEINIDINDIEGSIDLTKAHKITLNGDSISAENNCAEIKDTVVKIKDTGIYELSGTLTDGQVKVAADDNATVVIVLNGVDITNKHGCAIHIKKAKQAFVVAWSESENKLSDTENYEFSADDTDGEPDATIFSKSDLVVAGKGTLNIDANYSTAIKSKDNLIVKDLSLSIDSVDDGIKGRDSLELSTANIKIDCKNDGIKTTNDEDDTLGNLKILSGNFEINAGKDAIHSKNQIDISGGDFKISCEDDGVHSDSILNITDGNIKIEKSYEGLEAENINISGGNIEIKASDDGINAAGGNDSSQQNGFGGGDKFKGNANASIKVTGGFIYINADGDGFDSNGTAEMTGGTLLVDGPTNGGNGAVDYEKSFTMTGGLLVACGSSEMAQAVSDTSTQNCIMVNLSRQSADTLFNLSDSNGNSIVTYSPSKEYQNVVICSDKIKTGETYTISTGGQCSGENNHGLYQNGEYTGGTKAEEITVNSVVTSNSGFMGGMGGPNGGMGRGNNMEPPNGEMRQEPPNGRGKPAF